MFVVAMEGIAVVVPISKEEFQTWLRTYPTALEVFGSLGVVVVRASDLEAKIPSFRCKSCGDLTGIHELFGGVCRRCSGLEMRQA